MEDNRAGRELTDGFPYRKVNLALRVLSIPSRIRLPTCVSLCTYVVPVTMRDTFHATCQGEKVLKSLY